MDQAWKKAHYLWVQIQTVGGVGPGAGRIGCTGPESGNLEDWAIARVQELRMVRYALVAGADSKAWFEI
ncbi:hypothetical protein PS2_037125 [Malus domestica]